MFGRCGTLVISVAAVMLSGSRPIGSDRLEVLAHKILYPMVGFSFASFLPSWLPLSYCHDVFAVTNSIGVASIYYSRFAVTNVFSLLKSLLRRFCVVAKSDVFFFLLL